MIKNTTVHLGTFLMVGVLVGCAGTAEELGPPRSQRRHWGNELPDPIVQATIGYAGGRYDHETSGSILDDDTSAGIFRIAAEGVSPIGIGGGLALEIGATDDDLFENVGVSGGEIETFDGYLHATFRVSPGPQFRMPIRIGPYFHVLSLEDDTPDDLTWASFGARIQIEPEVLLVRAPEGELGLFSELSLGTHVTRIDFDSPGADEEYDSDGYTAGLNIGLRGRWTGFTISLSYLARYFGVDESDTENGTFVREIDTRQDGLLLELGFSY